MELQWKRHGTQRTWWILVVPSLLGCVIGDKQVVGDLITASPSFPQCGVWIKAEEAKFISVSLGGEDCCSCRKMEDAPRCPKSSLVPRTSRNAKEDFEARLLQQFLLAGTGQRLLLRFIPVSFTRAVPRAGLDELL